MATGLKKVSFIDMSTETLALHDLLRFDCRGTRKLDVIIVFVYFRLFHLAFYSEVCNKFTMMPFTLRLVLF